MGFAISWLAVKNVPPEKVLEYFDFSETQEKEEIPKSDICSAMLPSGWYMIWFNQCESPFVQGKVISKLSENCSVVGCVVEEHVMYSRSEYWENGHLVWQIIHDSQKGIFDLQESGKLPDGFELMKSDIFSKQEEDGGEKADVDHVFDLPLEILKELTFFKHDEETPELEGQEYTILKNNKKDAQIQKSKPWWKVW